MRDRVVAVTRDGDPDDRLVGLLEAGGARVVVWPTLVVSPPANPGPLTRAAAAIADYDWVAFTSARAVDALTELVPEARRDTPVAAVGAATAAAAERVGWNVRLTGSSGAEALAEQLVATHDVDGARVLFPAASLAGGALEAILTAAGVSVERVVAYRTVERPPAPDAVRRDLSKGVDVVTFASPSAVRALAAALGGTLSELSGTSALVAIGPSTRHALQELGVTDVVVASAPDLERLVEACGWDRAGTRAGRT